MANPFDYSGKRIVVTGGFSGVGAALLELLADMGASDVTVLDIKAPAGPHSTYIETNMADADSVQSAIDQLADGVDVLFNNAGVAATQPMETVMAVNWLGLRQLSEGLLPKMNEGGAIVNTSSIAGGQWHDHLDKVRECIAIEDRDALFDWCKANAELVGDGYSFSKECVQIYTMTSAKETLKRKINTNSVCPAPIDTPLLPDFNETMTKTIMDWTIKECGGEIATPRDIAMTLAFLGTEAARYIGGVNLAVDRGFSGFMTTGLVDFSSIGA